MMDKRYFEFQIDETNNPQPNARIYVELPRGVAQGLLQTVLAQLLEGDGLGYNTIIRFVLNGTLREALPFTATVERVDKETG